jgi:hypothetical protein
VRNKLAAISLVIVGFLAVSVPMFAHHGNASYDSSKTVTVKGTVTEYVWANPHVFLKLDAKDDSGNTLHWTIEAQNRVSQIDVGWSKNTFKPGDEVIMDCYAAKNAQPIGKIGFTTRIVINGKQFKP